MPDKKEVKVDEWSIVVHWNDDKTSWLSSYLFDLSTNKDIFKVINEIWGDAADKSLLEYVKEAYVTGEDKELKGENSEQ